MCLVHICALLPVATAGELFKSSKDAESLVVSIEKDLEVLDLNFYVSDVVIGVNLGFLVDFIGPKGRRLNIKFFVLLLKKLGKIRIFKVLNWSISVCGWQEMAKKTYFRPKKQSLEFCTKCVFLAVT